MFLGVSPETLCLFRCVPWVRTICRRMYLFGFRCAPWNFMFLGVPPGTLCFQVCPLKLYVCLGVSLGFVLFAVVCRRGEGRPQRVGPQTAGTRPPGTRSTQPHHGLPPEGSPLRQDWRGRGLLGHPRKGNQEI